MWVADYLTLDLEFPSPCGVLVLKLNTMNTITVTTTYRFRPLAGFWFLNDGKETGKSLACLFPSPCGVLVLKWLRADLDLLYKESFRPLAGFWFLNYNSTRYCYISYWIKFPSPCGVLVLKYVRHG